MGDFSQQELLGIIDDKVKYTKKLRKEKDDEIDTITATIAQKDAELVRLQSRVQELEDEQRWIPVGEADLQTWKKYIVLCKSKYNKFKTYTTLAQYFLPKTVLEEDFIDDQFYGEESITEYDEENDCYWVKEGWFEYTYEGEMGYRLSDEVVLVMPLPQPPKDGM